MEREPFSLGERPPRRDDRVRTFGPARVVMGAQTARLTQPEDYRLSVRSGRAVRFLHAAGFGHGEYGREERSLTGVRLLSIWQRVGDPDAEEMKAIVAEEAMDDLSVDDDYTIAGAKLDARDEDAENPDSPNYAWRDAPPIKSA